MIPLSAIAVEAGITSESVNDSEQIAGLAPVFVYSHESQSVELRRVQIGDLRDNQVSVHSGLMEGDEVVVAGVAFSSRWNES